MEKKRLRKTDWIEAGLAALSADGPQALKAEPMAAWLGTTKGSFYWHFKDVPDFHSTILAAWADHATAHLTDALAGETTAPAQLRRLGQIVTEPNHPLCNDPALEPAIRAWARADAAVAKRLEQVDGERIALLHGLLSETGITNPEMARLIYAANIGMAEMSTRDGADNAGSMGSLVDLVLALS